MLFSKLLPVKLQADLVAISVIIIFSGIYQFYHLFVQVEYIRQHSKTEDGKLLAIGHSMGGILLYAMLSRSGETLILLCDFYAVL